MKNNYKERILKKYHNEKNLKNGIKEKGITLVALVITIIILLILAGITIRMATSGTGVFGRAKNAVNNYRMAVTNENATLEGHDSQIDTATSDFVDKVSISNADSFVGYYADFEGDGTVDGVIFADMAKGNTKSGIWNLATGDYYAKWGKYDITKKNDLNEYYISNESFTGKFGTHPVVSLKGKKSNNHDKDRFYVMALKDVDGSDTSTKTYYRWYMNANNISDFNTQTSESFGSGRQNTINMLAKWNKGAEGGYGAKNENEDMWAMVQNKVNEGWFVASRSEMAAFAAELEILNDRNDTEHGYLSLGLDSGYWTSSLDGISSAYVAYIDTGYMSDRGTNKSYHVRLTNTF